MNCALKIDCTGFFCLHFLLHCIIAHFRPNNKQFKSLALHLPIDEFWHGLRPLTANLLNDLLHFIESNFIHLGLKKKRKTWKQAPTYTQTYDLKRVFFFHIQYKYTQLCREICKLDISSKSASDKCFQIFPLLTMPHTWKALSNVWHLLQVNLRSAQFFATWSCYLWDVDFAGFICVFVHWLSAQAK